MINSFQNIYIEKKAKDYPLTQNILKNNLSKNIIWIEHYKDVFSRPRQNYQLQKENQSLILAVKNSGFFFSGSNVCQDFGNKNFYYSSSVMNCICNCEYCFLKGMYESGNLVAFVNLQDYFQNVPKDEAYICTSYDTDLFPLENTFGYIKKWMGFAKNNTQHKLEFRTKFKNLDVWNYEPLDNVIFAFSLSPQNIIEKYEHKTSNLVARLENICKAQENGHKVRLCFDPIIYCKNWKNEYSELIETTLNTININKLEDISIGSFRISQSYLKNMRKNSNSEIVNFPFSNINGFYQYPIKLQTEMEEFVFEKLKQHFDSKRIFLWK